MQVFQKGRFTVSMPEAMDDCKDNCYKSRFTVVCEETEYPYQMVSRKGRFTLQYPTCAGHSTTEFILGNQVIEFTPKKAITQPQDNSAPHIQVPNNYIDSESNISSKEATLKPEEEDTIHKPTAPKPSRFSFVQAQTVDARQLPSEGAVQKGLFFLEPSSTTCFKSIELDEQYLKLFDSYTNFDVGLEVLQLKQKKPVSSSGLCTMNYLFAVQAKIKLATICGKESKKLDIPERSSKFSDIRNRFEQFASQNKPPLVMA